MRYVYKGNQKNVSQPSSNPMQLGKMAECGTPQGYRRHRYAKEKPCDNCRAAYSKHRGHTRQNNVGPLVCGTERGYKQHLRKKEETCDACKKAHAEYARELRKKAWLDYRRRNN